MCSVNLKDRFPSNELRERLGIDDVTFYYSKTGCDGMGICCENKIMIVEMYGV